MGSCANRVPETAKVVYDRAMQEHILEPQGLYYRTNTFQPNRQTLVFAHGLSGSSSAWIPYEEKFRGGYNIVTFDLRGHGKSRKPRGYGEYAIEKFADDLDALLRHLQIKKYILISHSFGTLVAFKYLRKFGQTPTAALFFSPNYKVKKNFWATLLYYILFFVPALSIFPVWKKTGRHINYNLYRHTGDYSFSRMSVDIISTSLRVYLYCIQQAFKFSDETFLSQIHIPTLIVHGGQDSIFPVENAKVMATLIPGAELKVIEPDNHILVVTDLAGSIQVIEEFVVRYK